MTLELDRLQINLEAQVLASETLSDGQISIMDEIKQTSKQRAEERLSELFSLSTQSCKSVIESLRPRAETFGWGDQLDHSLLWAAIT